MERFFVIIVPWYFGAIIILISCRAIVSLLCANQLRVNANEWTHLYEKNSFFFYKLNLFSLPFFIYYYKSKHTIYIYEYSNWIKKINYLGCQKSRVRLMSYDDIYSPEWKTYKMNYLIGNSIYQEHIKLSGLLRRIAASTLKTDTIHEKKFEILFKKSIYTYTLKFAEFATISKQISTNNNKGSVFVIQRPFLISRAQLRAIQVENTYPALLVSLSNFFEYSVKFFKIAYKKMKTYVLQPKVKKLNQGSEDQLNYDFSSYKTAFFPHCGIYYSIFFSKDHFYDLDDLNSPLHPSNIVHIEDSSTTSLDYLKNTNDFLRMHNSPYLSLQDLQSFSKKEFINSFFGLLMSLSREQKALELLKSYQFLSLFILFLLRARLAQSGIEKFPNLKVALIGHEVLFPPWVNLALISRDIKTVASQERLLLTFAPTYSFSYDLYFSQSMAFNRFATDNSDFLLGKVILSGPARLDLMMKEHHLNKEFCDIKYGRIKESRKLCLVLPYHLASDYNEKRFTINSLKLVLRFYQDIWRLSKQFPNIHFVFKAKDNNMLHSKEFSDIIDLIKKAENASIETDLDYYNPYKMAILSDFSISMQTSLTDEMLAFGKPAFFYDYFGNPSDFYDYEKLPVIATSLDELKGLISFYLNNKNELLADIQAFNQKTFKFNSDIPVNRKIKNSIISFYQDLL
jgi:hypothetical protein